MVAGIVQLEQPIGKVLIFNLLVGIYFHVRACHLNSFSTVETIHSVLHFLNVRGGLGPDQSNIQGFLLVVCPRSWQMPLLHRICNRILCIDGLTEVNDGSRRS